MTKYIIFYGDGSTITDEECSPDQIPKTNIQVIVQEDKDHGWHTVAQGDYYVWGWYQGSEPYWCGVDQFGLYDYLTQPGYKVVGFGRTITAEQYDNIFRIALSNTYLPKKTAFSRGEIKPNG